MTSQPIIREIKDNEIALEEFENEILPNEDDKVQEVIMNFPTVYIHNWPETGKYGCIQLGSLTIFSIEQENIIITE